MPVHHTHEIVPISDLLMDYIAQDGRTTYRFRKGSVDLDTLQLTDREYRTIYILDRALREGHTKELCLKLCDDESLDLKTDAEAQEEQDPQRPDQEDGGNDKHIGDLDQPCEGMLDKTWLDSKFGVLSILTTMTEELEAATYKLRYGVDPIVDDAVDSAATEILIKPIALAFAKTVSSAVYSAMGETAVDGRGEELWADAYTALCMEVVDGDCSF